MCPIRRTTSGMFQENVGRGDRGQYMIETRKKTDNMFEDWRSGISNVDDVAVFHEQIRVPLEKARTVLQTRGGRELLDDAMQSVTEAVYRRVEAYDHRMLRACVSLFDDEREMLEKSIMHDINTEGTWEYEIWDCFWNLMSKSAVHNDLYIFTKCVRIFTGVAQEALGPGCTANSSILIARIIQDCARACMSSKSYALLAVLLDEMENHELATKGMAGPGDDTWRHEISELLSAILSRIIQDDDADALNWVFDTVLYIQASVTDDNANPCGPVMPEALSYCYERGRTRLLVEIMLCLLQMESSGSLPSNPDWLGSTAATLETIMESVSARGDPHEISEYYSTVRAFPEGSKIRDSCMAGLDSHKPEP